jgi:ubiquitin carboxyl-terminal hydrolase L3
VAVCLLFPSSKITGPRRAELRSKQTSSAATPPPPDLFFLQQHDGIGNACGTIACVHAVAAGATSGAFSLTDGVLKRFMDETSTVTPAARGWKLTETSELKEMSDATAAAGETQGAGTDDAMDSHFIAFVQRAGLPAQSICTRHRRSSHPKSRWRAPFYEYMAHGRGNK